MEQAYIIYRLKEITIPELLNAIAEANAGEAIDIYETSSSRTDRPGYRYHLGVYRSG